jgi:cytochrome c biogenesis protein CcmG, thiol:disulfide interchange protein DsbE
MFAKSGSGWPVIDDSKAKVDFGVRGVPESFLVDPQGIVLARITGGVTEAGLDRLLTQAKERTS